MNIEKMYEGEGGYVFVSHSHLDLKEVREVRNYLEENGVEPILFYLRSMENCDEDRLSLLRKLIYEEIDSREFFLYLESENSKNSQWVQEEVSYITETAPDKVFTASLDDGVDSVKSRLREFLRQMRVYISASYKDVMLANQLKKVLLANDFRVYADNTLAAGVSWFNEVTTTLKDLSEEGSVIVLLTENSLQSEHVLVEMEYAMQCGGTVVPVIVGDPFLTKHRLAFLKTKSYYQLKSADDVEGMENLVRLLKQSIRRK